MFVLVCVSLNLCWYVLVGKCLNFGVILFVIRDFSNGAWCFLLIYDLYTNLLHCYEVFVPCVHSTSKQFEQYLKRLVYDIIGNHKKEGN